MLWFSVLFTVESFFALSPLYVLGDDALIS